MIKLFGAQRRISCGYFMPPPNNKKAVFHTFWPHKVNQIHAPGRGSQLLGAYPSQYFDMRFDPQANGVSDAGAPLPAGMSVRSPLKTAVIILAIGFVGGGGVWLWSEGFSGQQKASAETSADTAGKTGISADVVQYAEAVINGKTESDRLAAVTGNPVDKAATRRIVRNNPRSPIMQEFKKGKSLVSMGRYEEALPHLMEAIRLDPDFAEAHYRLGLAHVRLGNMRAARRERAKLEKLDTELANLLAHLVSN